jgi:hypothetical protein
MEVIMPTDSNTKICSIPGCGKFVRARGYCAAHYNRWNRTGDPLGVGVIHSEGDPKCSVDECDKFVYIGEYCQAHYNRWYRHGDPLGEGDKGWRRGKFSPVEDRIWSKVDTSDPDGCWPWTGAMRHAYGEIMVDGKKTYAHRAMYEMLRGKLEQGQVVMHKCDNPACVRPDHLIEGTQRDNLVDMSDKGRWGNQTRVNQEPKEIILNADLQCSIDDCESPVLAKGLCRKHYLREWKKKQ